MLRHRCCAPRPPYPGTATRTNCFMGSEVRKRPGFHLARPYRLDVFMPLPIRRCVQCSKCLTRYLIGFSPYRNGAYLVATAHGSSDEYTLYCSCCQPPAPAQWKWSEMKPCAVAKAAHERGYGSCEEIVPVAEKWKAQPAAAGEIFHPRKSRGRKA
jgi:hypothetical protein